MCSVFQVITTKTLLELHCVIIVMLLLLRFKIQVFIVITHYT